ncbi:fibronectin type III domain-containing protein [Persicobacter psychrovividus]|uniref:Fibronectin type-III domain-containing protein n=1 Tax=Persicobacter psychrovividus TaxID=387638 RepID=A0ABM7VLG6_9BACT|nr:hypothetical protein PEPS_41070 [Persicobacter psychrovividus]
MMNIFTLKRLMSFLLFLLISQNLFAQNIVNETHQIDGASDHKAFFSVNDFFSNEKGIILDEGEEVEGEWQFSTSAEGVEILSTSGLETNGDNVSMPYLEYKVKFNQAGSYGLGMLYRSLNSQGEIRATWDWDGSSEIPSLYFKQDGKGSKFQWSKGGIIKSFEAGETHTLTIAIGEYRPELEFAMFAITNEWSGWKQETADLIPTNAPTNISATTEAEGKTTLSWDKAEIIDVFDQDEDITYHIVINGNEVETVTGVTSYEYTFADLEVSHEAYIYTTDGSGNTSKHSDTQIILDKEVPTTPSDLEVSNITAESALLTWTASEDNVGVDYYLIYLNDRGAIDYHGSDAQLSLSNLEDHTEYNVAVVAVDVNGNKSAEGTTSFKTLDGTDPSIPADVVASAITETGFTLNWTASTDNSGMVEGYKVKIGDAAAIDVNEATYTVTDLTAYTKYAVQVSAYDASGNESEYSTALEVMTIDETAPTPPEDFAIEAIEITETSIKMEWPAFMDNSGTVAGYKVKVDSEEFDAADNSFELTDLRANTVYRISISAYDAAGNASSFTNIERITTIDVTAPSVPEDLKALGRYEHSLSIGWDRSTDNSGQVDGYKVMVGDQDTIALVHTNSYTVLGLAAYTTYTVKVAAVDHSGNVSDYSAAIDVMTTDETNPTVPTDLMVENVTETTADLSWTASTDNDQIAKYMVVVNGGPAVEVDGMTNNLAIMDLIPLSENTAYVYAVDRAGNMSTHSDQLTFQTIDSTAPTVPQNLIASDISETGFVLNWTASTDNVGVVGYKVKVGDAEPLEVATTTLTVTNLEPYTNYEVSVSAFDASGNASAYSEEVTVMTTDNTAPTVPENVVASEVTINSANLSWNAAEDNVGIKEYIIYLNEEMLASTSETVYELMDLTAETTYSFAVVAVDLAGNKSAMSETVSFTTDKPLSSTPREAKFKVYPNPAVGQMTIAFQEAGTAEYAILNMSGQQIRSGSCNKPTMILNLPSGLYIFRVKINDIIKTEVIVFK